MISPDTIPDMFTGIEHFAVASPNAKRLADWYSANLGFETVFEYDGNFFVEAANGALIEIIPSLGDKQEATNKTPGLRHIAIAVTDFDAAYAQLQKQGVAFTGAPFVNQGNRLVFFTDPDGNLIHLIAREKPLPRRTKA